MKHQHNRCGLHGVPPRLKPRVDQGDRPDFDDFVPLRYTVTYPRGRTFGVTALMRFGAAVRAALSRD